MSSGLPFVVEPMTLADVAQVMEIERVAFPAPWSARAYRYEIEENEYSTMLVLRGGVHAGRRPARLLDRLKPGQSAPVLGYAGGWHLVDEIHISTIAVHPQWRGRGLGGLLLISLLDRGMELGAQKATLEVRVSNLVAQGLYHKYGFRIASRQKRYYADNNEDAYIMVTPPFDAPGFLANLGQRRSELYERLQVGGARTG